MPGALMASRRACSTRARAWGRAATSTWSPRGTKILIGKLLDQPICPIVERIATGTSLIAWLGRSDVCVHVLLLLLLVGNLLSVRTIHKVTLPISILRILVIAILVAGLIRIHWLRERRRGGRVSSRVGSRVRTVVETEVQIETVIGIIGIIGVIGIHIHDLSRLQGLAKSVGVFAPLKERTRTETGEVEARGFGLS